MDYDRIAYLGCKWALEYLNIDCSYEVVFDTTELKDPKILDDMRIVMDNLADGYRTQWSYAIEGNNIVYTQTKPCDERKRCWLKIFDSNFYDNAYTALYDMNGELVGINCLIVWNKKKCDIWNQGYFDGRVPKNL
jgi:hypothetical protein